MEFNSQRSIKKIKEVMNTTTISLESTATASDAAKLMETSKVKAIVVVEKNKLIGIVTDRDYTIKIGSHAYPIDTPISRLMSCPLISIEEDCEISTALELMEKNKINKLPVTSNEKITGMVSMSDLIV
ncbi:MAG: CBS domain-containing protein [Nitrosopumilus sp.]|jgi:CBS domain-containing protein|nr:CBS domain-containing protein [Nitrosopumilus sp.]MBT3573981.1 CBS domain-containing protein [Nitrosopumilus sp.]MBT3861663.1 CBS domain-containing protein [Nitrosopumilus sp.]MBT3956287.1 CBS domain-containing protein [Nitrosopumilus sp.]MBT5278316.1 CBS domain-containing protein [Nitrosopumilus sp.]